jgi:hypothetical protein
LISRYWQEITAQFLQANFLLINPPREALQERAQGNQIIQNLAIFYMSMAH